MNSVLLISMDTLRADHLGCYGYPRKTSPNLDRLAGGSALFENAFAPCSYTVPSFTSLMTGRLPSWHTARFLNRSPISLAPDMVPLAELMAAAGYRTAAFISTIVLSRPNCGLARGFEIYDDETAVPELNRPDFLYRRGEDTTDAAISWLKGIGDEPFFLWVHYMDVHGPYDPPAPYTDRFAGDNLVLTPFDRLHLPLINTPVASKTAPKNYMPGIPAYQVLNLKLNDRQEPREYGTRFRTYLDRYDGAIFYADLCIGHLLAWLKKLERYDETVIIVHSDHGEAFGEEGVFFFHGLTLTPDQTHVPLMVKAGDLPPGRYEHPVSLCDIMPYLIEVLELDEIEGLMGRSLLAGPNPGRLVAAQLLRQLAVINNGDMYLYGRGWFEPEENGTLFNRRDGLEFLQTALPPRRIKYQIDPLGLRPLPPGPSEEAINKWVAEFVEQANAQSFESMPLPASPGTEESLTRQLQSLGYLE